MYNIKISIITVCYNAQDTIERCIQSVLSQNYSNVEYIVIDGSSVDGTKHIIKTYQNEIKHLISEPDNGIYDAMNKGISLASGDVVGILNADDHFTDRNVLSLVAEEFSKSGADILYGDLNYVDHAGRIVRKWRSGAYKEGIFNFGWMPPHPTFYCKKELFKKYGNYSLNYGTAADYELMMRFIHLKKASVHYLKKVVVEMCMGGVSNRSFFNRLNALKFDLKAMYMNEILLPPVSLIMKPLRKFKQFTVTY